MNHPPLTAQPTTTRQRLLNVLADQQAHSGADLAVLLNLSRAAVWKQIQSLRAAGLRIDASHGNGYRLITPIELLHADKILSLLPAQHSQTLRVLVFDELASTNQYLMQLPASTATIACLAERQTAGRGRRGRSWISPYATSLACSLRKQCNVDAGRLAGLSLVVGVVVATVLEAAGVADVQLKWPNDLLHQGRKIGGILIEISGDLAGPCALVIGIGLNINPSQLTQAAEMQQIEQPWVDMYSVSSQANLSRNRLTAELLSGLLDILPVFEADGFAAFIPAYQQRDALYNRPVRVKSGNASQTGIAVGVNAQGELRLRVGADVRNINAGEVSVIIEATA